MDWDGIIVSTPMWDLPYAAWRYAPVCDDADRWLMEPTRKMAAETLALIQTERDG